MTNFIGRPANPDGPTYPLRLAIPINAEIQRRLESAASTAGIAKTTLARKLLVDALKGEAA